MNERFGQGQYLTRHSVHGANDLKIARYLKSPELGPRVLFFSGGTALNNFSQRLKKYTYNSIHIVTPFDSGGSSAVLRKAFQMPAVGDMRSRMMALADESALGHPEVFSLFTHRLPADQSQSELRQRVEQMQLGKDRLVKSIPEPMRSLICDYLGYFLNAASSSFDFKGASIGNLILTGGYLGHNRSLDPIAFLFSKLVHVRGIVRTITDEDTELCVTTESGKTIIGQHLITGKEVNPLSDKIVDMTLAYAEEGDPLSRVRKQGRRLIRSAELVVFPPGSFYSSILANLLPKGVGKAIMDNPATKVYVPNLGNDPEQFGMTLQEQIEQLERFIARDTGKKERCIDILLTDSRLLSGIDETLLQWLDQRGIQLLDVDLSNSERSDRYDETKLCEAILSLT